MWIRIKDVLIDLDETVCVKTKDVPEKKIYQIRFEHENKYTPVTFDSKQERNRALEDVAKMLQSC